MTCDVLSKALAQLQQLPRELEKQTISSWPGGKSISSPGGSPALSQRRQLDMYGSLSR
jgi:hypothetical protein